MARFIKRCPPLAASILGLTIWITGFFVWSEVVFHPPLDKPIGLVPAGRIEQDIHVWLEAPHQLHFIFATGTRPHDEVRRLLGKDPSSAIGMCDPLPCGAGVPLRWSLTNSGGHTVASGDAMTSGVTGWSAAEFWRPIGRPIELKAGYYRFRAEVTHDVPELADMSARLSLALPGGKTSIGWPSDLRFFGGLVTVLALMPLAGMLCVILIGLEIRDRWRAGSP